MSTDNPNTDDLQDRLLDQALRETLGGEAPPDLTQQILSAASEQSSQRSTLAIGDEAMNTNHKKSRKRWMVLTVAASLLVVTGGLLFNANQNSLRYARVAKSTEQAALAKKPSNEMDKLASGDKLRLMEESSPAKEEEVAGRPGLKSVQEQSKERVLDESLSDISGPIPSTQLAASSPRGAGNGGQLSKFGVALDTPGRSNSFGLALPNDAPTDDKPASNRVKNGSASPNALGGQAKGKGYGTAGKAPILTPDANHWQNLKRRREKFAAVDLSSVPAIIISDDERLGIVNEPLQRGQGSGPDASGDQYTRIYENPFITADGDEAVSTFSIDVDTASYANVRQFLMQSQTLPPPDAVRIEELVNYFDYNYSGPTGDVPFASHVEIAGCPWHPEHRLLRVGIKGREIELENRPQSNLVFLIDVSGSMNDQNKLPLLIQGMKLLTRKLTENDRVAIVVYASSEGLALDSTRGDKQDTILAALEKLRAGGSTAGGAGIQLAYQIAQDNFIEGGTNRVILATDGDFNVGTTSTADLERMAESKAKDTGVFLTVLGFGRGNLNDAMMEAISGKGNGNYHYIDGLTEARKVLVEEMTGTLMTIAKDVKIQIEFNPTQVAGYRLIGYENRMLRTEDFNNDKKDAGEIGAGHTVTAIYEIVPAGKTVDSTKVDPLKYQQTTKPVNDGPVSDDLMTLKIRYKRPDGDTSTKLEFPITDAGQPFAEATDDFKFAAAVASFGMLLRDSEHKGTTSFGAVLEIAEDGSRRDPHGYRAEFLQLVRKAKELRGEK